MLVYQRVMLSTFSDSLWIHGKASKKDRSRATVDFVLHGGFRSDRNGPDERRVTPRKQIYWMQHNMVARISTKRIQQMAFEFVDMKGNVVNLLMG